MDRRWRIELLGGLRAARGDQVVARFRTHKTAALLGYLSCFHPRSFRRDFLFELLWPESEVKSASHNLSAAIYSLREQLEPDGRERGSVLVTGQSAVGLSPSAVFTDVAEFEATLEAAEQAKCAEEQIAALAQAVELYQGELLPGHFESWIVPEQQRLSERFFQAVRRLIVLLKHKDDGDNALAYALRAVSIDPLREEAHQELMRLHMAAGRLSAALRQYRELERILRDELGTTPSPTSRALLDQVCRGDIQSGQRGSGAAEQRENRVTPDGPRVRRLPHGNHPSSAPPSVVAPGVIADLDGRLEPVGGAVPLDSPFYVVRPTDAEFHAAIARRESVVLVKGPRQVGKTSLLARGLQQAREAGARVVLTDLSALNAVHLESADTFLFALAQSIADQLGLSVSPADVWDRRRGPNPNLRWYLQREVLELISAPLVWGLDEVDRLFEYEFGGEVFALFRSWHNERAVDLDSPWARLTLVMAYATEAHLFITDLNQSPFNVGTRLALDDFTPEQVAELNRRYGSPLKDEGEIRRYYQLVGGHPYLVRRGLHEMVVRGADIGVFEARAASGDWIFGDHLERMLASLSRDPELCAAVREVLGGGPCPTPASFYRLRSAGVVAGDDKGGVWLRCQLYAAYLRRHLS